MLSVYAELLFNEIIDSDSFNFGEKLFPVLLNTAYGNI